jgi:hypothetical protein
MTSQMVARHVRVTQHFLRVFQRAVLRPRRLMKQPQELGGFEFFFFGKRNGSLEAGGHLILEYAPGECVVARC